MSKLNKTEDKIILKDVVYNAAVRKAVAIPLIFFVVVRSISIFIEVLFLHRNHSSICPTSIFLFMLNMFFAYIIFRGYKVGAILILLSIVYNLMYIMIINPRLIRVAPNPGAWIPIYGISIYAMYITSVVIAIYFIFSKKHKIHARHIKNPN